MIVVNVVAEVLGTFLLGIVVLASQNHPLVVGGTVALILFLTKSSSGGHINPATTLIRIVQQTVSPLEGVLYITAQVLAALGSLALYKWVV